MVFMNFNKNPFEIMSVPTSISNKKLFSSKILLNTTQKQINKNFINEIITNPKKRMDYELSTFHNPKYNFTITDENFKKFITKILDDTVFVDKLKLNKLHYIFNIFKNLETKNTSKILKEIENDLWGIHDLAVLFEKISYYYKNNKQKSDSYKIKALFYWIRLFKNNELLEKSYTFNLYEDEFTKKDLMKNWTVLKTNTINSLMSFAEDKILNGAIEKGIIYFNLLNDLRTDLNNKYILKNTDNNFVKTLYNKINSLKKKYKNLELLNILNYIADFISKIDIKNKIYFYKKLLDEFNILFEKIVKENSDIFSFNKLNKFFYLFNYIYLNYPKNNKSLLDESVIKLYLLVEKKVNNGFNIISTSEIFNNISDNYICKINYLNGFNNEQIRLRLIRNYVSKSHENEIIQLQIVSFLENISSLYFDRNYTLASIAEKFLLKGDLNNSLYIFNLIPNSFIISGKYSVSSYINDVKLRIKLRDLYYSDYNDYDFNILSKIKRTLTIMPKKLIIFDDVTIEEYLKYLRKKSRPFYFFNFLFATLILSIIIYIVHYIF
jgi:hypothetical protein